MYNCICIHSYTHTHTHTFLIIHIIPNNILFLNIQSFVVLIYYPRSLGYPISDSWPSRQCRIWLLSHGISLKQNIEMVTPTISVSTLPQHLFQKNSLLVLGVRCLDFSFQRLQTSEGMDDPRRT